MRIIKSTLVAGLISLLTAFSSFAEKVKIGDPGWTGATAIANLLAAVVSEKMGGESEMESSSTFRCSLSRVDAEN